MMATIIHAETRDIDLGGAGVRTIRFTVSEVTYAVTHNTTGRYLTLVAHDVTDGVSKRLHAPLLDRHCIYGATYQTVEAIIRTCAWFALYPSLNWAV